MAGFHHLSERNHCLDRVCVLSLSLSLACARASGAGRLAVDERPLILPRHEPERVRVRDPGKRLPSRHHHHQATMWVWIPIAADKTRPESAARCVGHVRHTI